MDKKTKFINIATAFIIFFNVPKIRYHNSFYLEIRIGQKNFMRNSIDS